MGRLVLKSRHRILCGDSTKQEDVDRLFDGEKAGLLFTSPPYAQQREYTDASREHLSDWDALMNGVFGCIDRVLATDAQVLVNLGLVHRDGEWLPYWDRWIEWMRSRGWRRFGWYVWDQQRGLPGDWNGRCGPSHEFVFHFNRLSRKPEKHIQCNQERASRERGLIERGRGKKGLRTRSGAVEEMSSLDAVGQTHKIPDSVWRLERHMANDIARQGHPATFPVSLVAMAVNSWPSDVYDPFCGSGTTVVASEQLGRRCYAMELEPRYCDISVVRWLRATNREAIRERDGHQETFSASTFQAR